MQKTIYVSNREIWDSIKHMAGEKSISRYLVDLHEANVLQQNEREETIRGQIDLISGLPEEVREMMRRDEE